MSPPRFLHKRITSTDFTEELARQNMSLHKFTKIWCQNLTTTTRWANGEKDIPTWVPIALTVMSTNIGSIAAKQAAAAMIEKDTLNPQWGDFPYLNREMIDDDGAVISTEEFRKKHRRPE